MNRNFWRGALFSLPVSLMIWALMLWILLASTARSAELATVAPDAQPYATAREAAEAALLLSEGSPTELAGGIILREGGYYFTSPVGTGRGDHFDIRLRFAGKLVAIYHTHPGEGADLSSTFSPEDRTVAKQLNVVSYIRSVITQSNYSLDTNGTITNMTGHTLCHGMECKDYYAMIQHRYLVLYGMVRE
jgi:hypothetical protein